MNTRVGDSFRCFVPISEVVGVRPGLQLVLSIGPTLDPKQITSLPPNAIVVNHAPQLELLKRPKALAERETVPA
jgi:hypothetical protein